MQVQCPICLENIETECVTLSCKHQFHKKCINKSIWVFEDKDAIDFKLNTCPICRNHLTCKDKQLTITGEQFTWVMNNILRTDIENKQELSTTIYDTHYNICQSVSFEPESEMKITAEQIYEKMVELNSRYLWDIENGDNSSEKIEMYRKYKTIIDICKHYFDFV